MPTLERLTCSLSNMSKRKSFDDMMTQKKNSKTKVDDDKLQHLSGNKGNSGDHYGGSFIRRPDY